VRCIQIREGGALKQRGPSRQTLCTHAWQLYIVTNLATNWLCDKLAYAISSYSVIPGGKWVWKMSWGRCENIHQHQSIPFLCFVDGGENPTVKRVPGLGQITWWIMTTKKLRGHSGKKFARKSRNSWCVNGRGCGCIGTFDSGPKCAQSWDQIQTLKNYIICHLYCVYCCTHLYRTVTGSRTVSL